METFRRWRHNIIYCIFDEEITDDGTLTLTLSNEAVVTLDAADGITDNLDGTFSIGGDYVVGLEDLDTFSDEDANTLELSIVSYTPDILDVSGNAVATDLVISEYQDTTHHLTATWISNEL